MLYLKKIEMYGFKSFADKVEMRFDQPITGIDGPYVVPTDAAKAT